MVLGLALIQMAIFNAFIAREIGGRQGSLGES